MQAVQAAQASLDDFDTLPPLGTDSVRVTFEEQFKQTPEPVSLNKRRKLNHNVLMFLILLIFFFFNI